VFSITGFVKKQKGMIVYSQTTRALPELNNEVRLVRTFLNASNGRAEGIEARFTSFFSFLPGALKNLGIDSNVTYIPQAYQYLPDLLTDGPDIKYDYPGLSKTTFNVIGLYDTTTFSARLAYNWRSKVSDGSNTLFPFFNTSRLPTSRLDAAVNVTPFRFLTLSVEGTNLTKSIDRSYYTDHPTITANQYQMARTIQASARFRF
jgi:hypothetical protein